ncbi:hypothetical protein FJ251_07990 [bacterium]|nr:hypothetical protein [bacterium]
MSSPHQYPTEPLWLRALLWVVAVLLMLAAVVYQRSTGPTYPRQGSFAAGGRSFDYSLVRSDWSERTNDAARVRLPDPGPQASGTLYWKRYRTGDAFTPAPLARETVEGEAMLVGRLPAQPAAGKLEYYLELETGEAALRVPPAAEANVVIRFKDHVPAAILVPHVILMFFAVLIGMRTGLAAIFAPSSMRRWSWVALIGMTVGGMVLGPIVQKYAFGEYWTGFPWGGDWTDNKMLVMWLSWVFACAVIGFRPKRRELIPRAAVLLGALVMSAVYLIPHSMGGSELDYGAVEQGVDPAEAIRTGKR